MTNKKVDYSKFKISPLPIILITPEAHAKLITYIDLAKGEISGLGEVYVTDKNTFLIENVYIFNQVTTDSDAELEPASVSKFMESYIKEGKDIGNLKLWWHSHAQMGAFWSLSTDMETVESFDNGVNEWMVSLVGNKRNEFLARLDIFRPIRVGIDRLNLQMHNPVSKKLIDQLASEVTAKVKYAPPAPVRAAITKYVPGQGQVPIAYLGGEEGADDGQLE